MRIKLIHNNMVNAIFWTLLLNFEGCSSKVYREAKLGGLPPTHQSESLKTNGFQIKLAEALSYSVACGRVFDFFLQKISKRYRDKYLRMNSGQN